jgi:hypothetical protein
MSRTSVGALATVASFAALSLTSQSSLAQGVDELGGYGIKRGQKSESKQEVAFELRVGRYVPDVDDSVEGSPFQDTFGTSNRYIFGAEVDWQLVRIPHFGTLAPGVGWGYTKFTAPAVFADGSGTSASDTRIHIMPMYLVGVARADFLMRDFRVPFVPYAKLGVGYAMWWSSDGKQSAQYEGQAAKGSSYGLTYALGGMFLLDWLDPDDAVSADGLVGINNSYFFAEWFRPRLDGFGSNQVLNVGSSSWVIGLALEI